MKHTGKSLTEVLAILADQGGLLALSGVSGDLRDIDEAAAAGNARAKLALNVYSSSVRHYLGAYLVELGGADVIVFTGGIGENRPAFRETVCRNLEELGIVLDAAGQSRGQGRGPRQRRRQPRAGLDHSDQRGIDRRRAGRTTVVERLTPC